MPVLDAARSAYAAGLQVLPVREDGTKAPDLATWRECQTTRLTVDEMRACDFGRRSGLGIVAGAVSGYVECWDFDDVETFEAFVNAAAESGLGDVVERIRLGYEDETPRSGRRWIVEYPESVIWADYTLARRPAGRKKVETLIELPTFAIVAPSNGAVHPSGKPYVRRSGGFDTIASYTEDEHDALLALARSFDEMPRRQHAPATPPKATAETIRPGDDFNQRTFWPELLEPHGWTCLFEREGVSYWRRPGKTIGMSATTNFRDSDLFYPFTSSTEFEPETSYSKFGAYALLEHGGDFQRAALALAKQGFGRQDDTVSVASVPTAPSSPRTLADVEATFARWIPDDDPVPTRTVLATYAANLKLDGDPVWVMLVSGSGGGKTERITPLAVMPDAILESSITGPAALLSGTARKERTKDATGGVLRKIPADGGLLVLKDFTSIIDMHRESRAEVLAALREIHDGRWDRSVGAEGGRTLTWTGHLELVAGCTTAIDTAHSVMSVMGARFLIVRLQADADIARSAFDHSGEEATMRKELREAVRGLLQHLPGQPYEKADVRGAVVALASYVARARSPVDRDHRGDIRLVLDPEAPTRIVKALVQLWRASGLLGLDRADAWELVRRVGMDSIPKLRRGILDRLADCPTSATTTEVAEAVEHPAQTTRRALEDLTAHRVVVRTPGGTGRADRWELASQTKRWLDQTVPALSDGGASAGTSPVLSEEVGSLSLPSTSSKETKIPNDDITGKVDREDELWLEV